MQAFHVAGAKVLADHHASPNGKSIEEKDHDIDDHGGRTDGSQSLAAYKISDHNRVNCIIEHLKYITQKKGHREGNQMF
jgi:hypothetical protein